MFYGIEIKIDFVISEINDLDAGDLNTEYDQCATLKLAYKSVDNC